MHEEGRWCFCRPVHVKESFQWAKIQCTIFPLCNGTNTCSSGLIRWPLSAVRNKPGNSRSLFSLSLPWASLDRTDPLVSLCFLFFYQYFHFMSITISLSLIPPSLQCWPTFQLTCLCKLYACSSHKKGDKGEAGSIGLCYCFHCCCLGNITCCPTSLQTLRQPLQWCL